jgi:DNA modification methylase
MSGETKHEIIVGDAASVLAGMASKSVQCCVTSPPYWGLRDYGHDGQIGIDATPEAYVARMVEVFREVRRVLREDGTLLLNLGDSYYAGGWECRRVNAVGNGSMPPEQRKSGIAKVIDGLKVKDLVGIPWRVAFALQADGWWLRQDIIWHKPNPMPESVRDRCTKAHEYVFLLTKGSKYFFDATDIEEPAAHGGTKNKRGVWTVASTPFAGAHFATMPTTLAELCIRAGTSAGGCCGSCGAPMKRQVAKTKLTRPRPNQYVKRNGAKGTVNSCANTVAGVETRTIGWAPGCDCFRFESNRPCMVLDPFGGSGTTGAVAKSLWRNSTLIELNPGYANIIRDRIEQTAEGVRA